MATAMVVDQALYRRTVLSNGLIVITEPMDHVRTVALGVWVAAGSRFEDVPRNGVSHFIEHILFKGTATRSALAIAEAMDAIGGQLNAFTDKEQTCYYLRVISEHLEEGLGVLADMLLHPAIDAEALERERQVLAEEIKMYEDAPDDLVHDVFAETLWPGHPLGRPVSGTLTTLAGLRRDDLRAYMADRYRPDAVLVTAAGCSSTIRSWSSSSVRLDRGRGARRRASICPRVLSAPQRIGARRSNRSMSASACPDSAKPTRIDMCWRSSIRRSAAG